ncbi:MAG: helix-turn-helix domain-containing protein [Lachnospiraceae bacterium]|nr:helix-turn-helix domain-containing protein [Lachnospiraceae bacterium]
MALSVCDTVSVLDHTGKEIVQRGTPLFPASCYLDQVSRLPVPWHWHDELEIFAVISGSAETVIGTSKVVLHKGEGIFINSEMLHNVTALPGEECILKSICWHAHLTGGRDDSIFWQKYTKPLMDDKTIAYIKIDALTEHGLNEKSMFLNAWQQCVDEPAGYEVEVRYLLSKIVLSLMEHEHPHTTQRTEKAMRDEERLKKMLSLIHMHYGENLTIGQIAGMASISVSEANRCFKSTLRTSPIQYVKKFRLEKALALMDTGLAISEIGSRCGFDDMSYFGKEFKMRYGFSPSEWRKRNQK